MHFEVRQSMDIGCCWCKLDLSSLQAAWNWVLHHLHAMQKYCATVNLSLFANSNTRKLLMLSLPEMTTDPSMLEIQDWITIHVQLYCNAIKPLKTSQNVGKWTWHLKFIASELASSFLDSSSMLGFMTNQLSVRGIDNADWIRGELARTRIIALWLVQFQRYNGVLMRGRRD